MSPASSGSLEIERYIGACLISSQSRHKKHYVHQDVVYPGGFAGYRNQRCNGGERWAGGMPLISFSNHQRCWSNRENPTPLSRLAVHTQGAPLILSNNKYRKNKARNSASKVNESKTKQDAVRENSTDAVSVVSDESSNSTNSDNCLPRIIKPRKRRKKDRKPPQFGRPLNQEDSFSTDSASPDIDINSIPIIPIFSQNDISETPKLHHSFEDIKELETDINGNVSCQCRYCDPSGQIWDIDRSCYSPFLTSPPFQFPESPKRYSTPISDYQNQCLIDGISTFSLEEGNKSPPSFPTRTRDLEVSTEIVTSLNGHRDLEIKFFSSNVNSDKSEPNECFVNKCSSYPAEE